MMLSSAQAEVPAPPKDDKALMLQKAWRGHRGRKEAQSFKAKRKAEEEKSRHREEDDENMALHGDMKALLLQKAWRGHKGRKDVKDLQHRRREEEERKRKEASSLLLQKAWRGHRGRKEVRGLRGAGAHGRRLEEEEEDEEYDDDEEEVGLGRSRRPWLKCYEGIEVEQLRPMSWRGLPKSKGQPLYRKHVLHWY